MLTTKAINLNKYHMNGMKILFTLTLSRFMRMCIWCRALNWMHNNGNCQQQNRMCVTCMHIFINKLVRWVCSYCSTFQHSNPIDIQFMDIQYAIVHWYFTMKIMRSIDWPLAITFFMFWIDGEIETAMQ